MPSRDLLLARVGRSSLHPCWLDASRPREALELLLPILDESETGWDWGLDSLRPKPLDHDGLGVPCQQPAAGWPDYPIGGTP